MDIQQRHCDAGDTARLLEQRMASSGISVKAANSRYNAHFVLVRQVRQSPQCMSIRSPDSELEIDALCLTVQPVLFARMNAAAGSLLPLIMDQLPALTIHMFTRSVLIAAHQ